MTEQYGPIRQITNTYHGKWIFLSADKGQATKYALVTCNLWPENINKILKIFSKDCVTETVSYKLPISLNLLSFSGKLSL